MWSRSRDFFSDLPKDEDASLDLRFQVAKELAPYGHSDLHGVEDGRYGS